MPEWLREWWPVVLVVGAGLGQLGFYKATLSLLAEVRKTLYDPETGLVHQVDVLKTEHKMTMDRCRKGGHHGGT